MKKILLTLLSLYFLTLTPIWAQVSTPNTPVVRKGARATLETPKAQSSTSHTSVHEEGRIANALQSASWLRSVYRLIDLTTPANAPLYYPEVTTPTRANLFAQICQLYQENHLPAMRTASYELARGFLTDKVRDKWKKTIEEVLHDSTI